MIGRFFHTPKARQFNIPYRYYSPEKEEMQEREKQIKMELGMLEDKGWDPRRRTDLHGKFRQAMHVSTKSATDARKTFQYPVNYPDPHSKYDRLFLFKNLKELRVRYYSTSPGFGSEPNCRR